MLPLWIIDLREQSDRRETFQSLLGQIDHVFMNGSCPGKTETEISGDDPDAEIFDPTQDIANRTQEADGQIQEANEQIEEVDESNAETEKDISTTLNSVADPNADIGEAEEISVEEQIEKEDKRKADKESIIDGCWWRYTQVDTKKYDVDISSDCVPLEGREEALHIISEKAAKTLYKFQSDLVIEGQKFIRGLRESNANPDIKFNIVVLGDVEENFTRVVFPSVAGLLQKEKGRILPHHIHQGMEIIGMIYIPSNINTQDVKMRESMRRTLSEIDVQHKVADMRGYDYMMIYQDVQARTDCHYSALNSDQLQEYLFQCIINLYYATNITHPLISGTASADNFYFSMGATSVFYDVVNEDKKARIQFESEFIRSIKEKGDDEKANLDLSILLPDDYKPSKLFNYEAIQHLDREEVKIDEPNPHPIKNFAHKFLKRKYYQKYLRDFTGKLMMTIMAQIDESTRGALEILASDSKKRFNDAKKYINERLRQIVAHLEANDGGLPTIISLFRKMQDSFSEKKKRIQSVIANEFWDPIIEKQVPPSMHDEFIEYHNAYEEDIRLKTGGTSQTQMKKEVVDTLNGLLSREATILSRLCRSVLLGIMLSLALVPVLNLISPHLIDLGKVRRYSEWWSVGIFFIPVLVQCISWFRHERKKKQAINNLKALYLHDAFARVANRIESEIAAFYNKMIALGERYVIRTEEIRDEIGKGNCDVQSSKPILPKTTFNQPLLGGNFGHDHLLPIPDAIDTEIRINYVAHKIGKISKKDYFLFLNQYHNVVMELYKDVDVCDSLIRRVNDSGKEELVTKEQQEKELQELWEQHLATFQSRLRNVIKENVVPRINDSVGEFLVANIRGGVVGKDVLESMVEYSANNGEATSSADGEMADLKINDRNAVKYVFDYISTPCKYDQVDRYNHLYQKYIFLTRWRSFDEFPLNRILPMEDFDEHIRKQRVYHENLKTQNKKNKRKEKKPVEEQPKEEEWYYPYPSTLLLWSLAPDDSSSEWFRLLNSEYFRQEYDNKEIFKEILNPDD